MDTLINFVEDNTVTTPELFPFVHNDGGRSNYFKANSVGDCVTRAISISSGLDYKEVYDELQSRTKNSRARGTNRSIRNGVMPVIYKKYLEDLGYKWVTFNKIGQKEKVHLNKEELTEIPENIILRLSRHISCIKGGKLLDTYDPSREGSRMVYGYWYK